ncbi:hypothetical protein OH77DRAFT_1521084 [Trametes cingulata]|nr:hypothetical protein OH77DRAFT_1521084 [Trametes cingulata]
MYLPGGGSYDMLLWRSTCNPNTHDRGQAAKACLGLVKALQARLPSGQLVLPSTPKNEDGSLYVAIFLKSSSAPRLDPMRIGHMLDSEAAKLRLSTHRGFRHVPTKLHDDFSEEQIANLNAASVLGDHGIAGEKDQILLSRRRLERMRAHTGDDLEKDIRAILDNLNSKEEFQSAWQTVKVVACGVIAFGGLVASVLGWAYTAYTLIQLLAGLSIAITFTGWVAICLPFALLGVAFAALAVSTKDAANVLLVVNNTDDKITFTSDHVANGEPGFYFYKKWSAFGLPMGFFGSLLGVAFSVGGRAGFSVGMDCPLTVLGGTNSIRVVAGGDAEKAAGLASDSGNEEDTAWIDGLVRVTVKRANAMGSVNWGVCIVDS